ncbi:hypothetical protein BDF20DRAFT_97679 [Mycotypha africana]|uniref:uncharacterized protein n=1 Tax=Mycotypha africana TaxID=64632 RepID=UPI002301587A|nr:uncharacterized protein BDF20DRAFT_97679 [Mycotypha africana]KAI8969990.1 hypothetical protein BDF20DRAFT_97679 [Mycotypha africana]
MLCLIFLSFYVHYCYFTVFDNGVQLLSSLRWMINDPNSFLFILYPIKKNIYYSIHAVLILCSISKIMERIRKVKNWQIHLSAYRFAPYSNSYMV